MTKVAKVDLDLLKRLVGELESALAISETIREDELDLNEYIIEMSKAAGLAAGIMQEATGLVGDIQMTVRIAQGPSSKDKEDPLTKLMGLVKGVGGGLPGSN